MPNTPLPLIPFNCSLLGMWLKFELDKIVKKNAGLLEIKFIDASIKEALGWKRY